jgi:hypothetical protein
MPVTFKVTDTKPSPVQSQPFRINSILPPVMNNGRREANNTHKLVRSSIDEKDANNLQLQGNSFVRSAFIAYNQHHNLVISPDDVWLAIMTQFSFYLNKNAEELRSTFVDFEGKKELVVYGGGSLFTANYEKLCMDMTEQIAKNIKDPTVREWVIPEFTTTTPNEKLVGAIVLMAAMKKYFNYKMCLMCNLPSVTLLGEVDDWKNIRERADRLAQYDTEKRYMAQWSEMLLPILDEFVSAAQGKPDVEFWNKIAHQEGGGSGPRYLSGWITAFCIFSQDGVWMGDRKTAKSRRSELQAEWLIINTNDIPIGYVTCPVTVDDNGKIYKTDLFAGHMHGVKKDENTIAPAVGWSLFVKEGVEDEDK